MESKKYSKTFRIMVAKETSREEMQGMEEFIAQKYDLRYSTVVRWRQIYQEYGENALGKNRVSSIDTPDAGSIHTSKYLLVKKWTCVHLFFIIVKSSRLEASI